MKARYIKNAVFCCFCLLLAAYAGIFLYAKITGRECFYVTNGSMGAAAPLGALVVTEKVPFETVEIGDIVSFYDQEGTAAFTHRVTAKDAENKLFFTKGDANALEDPVPASYDYFAGRAVWVIPFFGFFSMVLHSPAGIAVVLAVFVVFLLFEILSLKKRGDRTG